MYSLTHLSDQALLRDLAALLARDRATTAALLAHLAEVDARKLYLPAAHPSMFSYCVLELRLSEDAASKRIQAARTARRFPAIFPALADGRLHLAAVCLLAPHLTPENADELLAAAALGSKADVERLLAERFPRPDVPARIEAIAPAPSLGACQLSPGTVGTPGPLGQHAPGHVDAPAPRPRVTALAPERYALQVTIGQGTHDKLRHAQALLGHQLPSGDLGAVLERVLDLAIAQLEKRKFAATSRPRRGQRRMSASPRHIPAAVRRAVWARDGGQCTFVSAAGHRCPARTRLEYDHAEPVARGGRATVGGVRLRCRAHNQYAAERAFGADFMHHKREEARRAAGPVDSRGYGEPQRSPGTVTQLAPGRVEARVRAAAEANARATAAAARARAAVEVIPWLRGLGFRPDEARRAAARCEAIPDAPLEERVKLALSCFAKPAHGRAAGTPPTAT